MEKETKIKKLVEAAKLTSKLTETLKEMHEILLPITGIDRAPINRLSDQLEVNARGLRTALAMTIGNVELGVTFVTTSPEGKCETPGKL